MDAESWICPNGHPSSGEHTFCGICGERRGAPSPTSPPPNDAKTGITGPAAWTRRRTLWTAGVGLLVLVAAVAAVTLRNHSGAATVVDGTLTIVGGGGYTTDNPCRSLAGGGAGTYVRPFDYTDIYQGAQVKVLDKAGSIVGTGELSPGEYMKDNGLDGGDGCRFAFTIPLDSTSTHYQLVLGTRPPYNFAKSDLPLQLVVGGRY